MDERTSGTTEDVHVSFSASGSGGGDSTVGANERETAREMTDITGKCDFVSAIFIYFLLCFFFVVVVVLFCFVFFLFPVV